MRFYFVWICLTVFFTGDAFADDARIFQSKSGNFQLETVADNLEHPWSLAFLPSGEMLVTERPGRLNLIRKNGEKIEIQGLPEIADNAQGGLLDVLVHPDFSQNRTIFFSFSAGSALGGYGTEVAKARLNGPRLQDLQIIFKAEPKITGRGLHFGSRLLIGPDDKLYVTLGERYRMDEAQNTANHLGTIVRLNQDGSIPADNPFVGQDGFLPEIYTYGHRNVQGIAVHPVTREIWIHEHGPKGGDEINILEAGANYGWPEVTHGVDYSGIPITDQSSAPGMKEPLLHWTPSIAPSGMSFYQGDVFPNWRGDLFVGALVLTHLRHVILEEDKIVDQRILLKDLEERIRDVRTGPDGFLYIVTDHPQGRVMRLFPAG